MIVDTSAILAIQFKQSGAAWAAQTLAGADQVLMSTVNLTECLILFRSRQPALAAEFERDLLASSIKFIAPDVRQASLAAEARLRYPLNFGDCFAYALAKSHGLPLLTLDADFRHADIAVLLPPAQSE